MQKFLAASDTIQLQPEKGSQFYGLGQLTIPQIIAALIKGVVVVAAVIFFFILVIGGIRWIASGGDKAQTEAARNQITAALVGLVIVFAAWAIVALIKVFFGVDIFSLAIPSV
ncbi:MAG: hypothetical protein ACD_13C00149G0006 [uncultured bacterium]|nr:MAG: hypothetical protein ACD_13C00149G0006 [uncultured bacterium]